MRIMLENIPASLGHRQDALIKCLDAMTGAMPVRQEKKESGDHFFATVFKEGICLAKEDRLA